MALESKMADVHGVDVSWMAHGPSKDKATKNSPPSSVPKDTPKTSSQARQPIGSPSPPTTTTATSDATATPRRSHTRQRSNSINTCGPVEAAETNGASETKPIPIPKSGGLSRSNSVDRNPPAATPSPQRRSSWFSNISSKFSPSTPPSLSSAEAQSPKEAKPAPGKAAVLAQGAKQQGDVPYTPAPPRANPGNNILGLFRRLSSSAAGLGHGSRGNHGLVERRVLNVDNARERCDISELNQAKLRRVAFCVDVEIAPQPRYNDEPKPGRSKGDTQPDKNGTQAPSGEVPKDAAPSEGANVTSASNAAKDNATDAAKKKKEKKKKSEEERKARKEKKRRMAEANGTVPIEIRRTSSDSSLDSADGSDSPSTSTVPTVNPVRIYRRCCQLRETPILKKITEQLGDAANWSPETGVIEKLDLSGYWMQLPDLVTLGDYLAVMPVREIFLEGCGLTDEGLRVVLAGLLASKKPDFKRRRYANYADHSTQGGVIERLVLKNNKLGPEGWKHLCLFIYLCRSISFLDLSGIPFPHVAKPSQQQNGESPPPNEAVPPPSDISHLLSKALARRLAGSHLELLNLGDTNPAMTQLGVVIDGAIQCGLRRLGLAHNNIDGEGVRHIARYLEAGKCEGLDLGGNDLRDHVETIVESVPESHSLWALSLADCNLMPSSVCKFFPTLAKLKDFRFIDLSHNQELCKGDAKTIQMLRRQLPKMRYLKRIHLTDVSMTSEQAIALAEIIPEIPQLANITLTGNPELAKLADAQSESEREEACALYASFLAAARVSKTLISVEIEVPSEGSGEIVKALAKQVVAYCLRNMERLQVGDMEDPAAADTVIPYPDVLAHLVGREGGSGENDTDTDSAPDEDYVIGGTGVVKALACCLDNRGDDDGSRRTSLDIPREAETEAERLESGAATPKPRLPPGKAKDMSKHLLSSARKIRARLQPALARARNDAGGSEDLRKLSFLDQTLSGIIMRFEDEFPETREGYFAPELAKRLEKEGEKKEREREEQEREREQQEKEREQQEREKEGEREKESEGEDDDSALRPGSRSSSSSLHTIARPLDTEEGRTHRRGHRFRSSIVHSPEKYEEVLLASLDEMERDPNHVRMLRDMIEDLDDPVLDEKLGEKGPVRVFKEDGGRVVEALRAVDPEHWERFREAQVMARENVWVE